MENGRYEIYLKGQLVGWHRGSVGQYAFDSGDCSYSLSKEEQPGVSIPHDEVRYVLDEQTNIE